MADGGHIVAGVRLTIPIVEDLAFLARRMRADEIAQYLALTGAKVYEPDDAARNFVVLQGQKFVLIGPDNLPFCAGGFEEIRPDVFQTWMVGTEEGWAKHWRAITIHSRRLMQNLLDTGARRIQTYALASRTKAHEWYRRGLLQQYEGTCRQFFADGQDAVLYARVREVPDGR